MESVSFSRDAAAGVPGEATRRCTIRFTIMPPAQAEPATLQ